MFISELFDHFKPTTLAAVVVDLQDSMDDGDPGSRRYLDLEMLREVALSALIANCGEEDATRLLEEADVGMELVAKEEAPQSFSAGLDELHAVIGDSMDDFDPEAFMDEIR